MTINNLDMQDLVARSADRAQAILLDLMKDQEPFEALIAVMVASATMAKAIDMPRETLLEGTSAAFDAIVEVTPHATH